MAGATTRNNNYSDGQGEVGVRYKIHVTSATRDDLVLRAVASVIDAGNVHVWTN